MRSIFGDMTFFDKSMVVTRQGINLIEVTIGAVAQRPGIYRVGHQVPRYPDTYLRGSLGKYLGTPQVLLSFLRHSLECLVITSRL
jgi:hypothetical protein